MEKSAVRILIVDDEAGLLKMVAGLLSAEGFKEIRTVGSCAEAVAVVTAFAPQLIILDVMLPDGDGFSLYEKWRVDGSFDTPVIFLSARDEDAARLRGLGLGADDYITKPFLPEELMLRINAVLRRTYGLHGDVGRLTLSDAVIDWERCEVIRDGQARRLTAKEYALLRELADRRGRIATTDALCDALWADGAYGLEGSLMVHIRHIREKLEADPSQPKHLITVRGLGYRLE